MGANRDLVSVIVPVYNSEKYLRDCVDSIVHQTYQNLDIILVDDGATDSSGLICNEYARSDSRVRVIHKINGGNGDARNVGLQEAKGRWVVMADHDDILHKRQIEVFLAVAVDKGADIVVGWYRSFQTNEETQDDDIGDRFQDQVEVLTSRHLFDDQFVQEHSMILRVPWNKMCKRELYEGVKFPCKSKHDDTWTTWKLYEKSKRTVFVPVVLHYWRNNPDSFGRQKFDISHFDGMDAYKEQLEYFHREKRQRYVEIVFASYVEMFFWCYNQMKELEMDTTLLKPYWNYMKEHLGYMVLTKSLGLKQWVRYRYLVWYKIPRLIFQ